MTWHPAVLPRCSSLPAGGLELSFPRRPARAHTKATFNCSICNSLIHTATAFSNASIIVISTAFYPSGVHVMKETNSPSHSRGRRCHESGRFTMPLPVISPRSQDPSCATATRCLLWPAQSESAVRTLFLLQGLHGTTRRRTQAT